MKRCLLTAFALVAFTGCNIYFGGDDDDDDDYGDDDDDDDDDCAWGGAADPIPGVLLRDPYTGQCIDFGGGGGPCDDPCLPCDQPAAAPLPPYGLCESYCSGLDEVVCLATPGCRGAYLDSYGGDDVYYECWAVDQSGPIQGSCDGLDAWSCSQHDDCIAIHESTCDQPAPPGEPEPDLACVASYFTACAAEPPVAQPDCWSDGDCGPGAYCNNVDVCLPPPPGAGDGDEDSIQKCWGFCTPIGGPGSCYEQAFCESVPPVCPEGTVPGVSNGCWTGVCIALEACGPPPCSTFDEQTCLASDQCEAYYQGIDCTCDEMGSCVCNEWAFTACLGADVPPPDAPSDPADGGAPQP